MLALRKPALEQSAVNIESVPHVEVIAYPSFERSALNSGATSGEPQEYRYLLKAATKGSYVAEGTIQFPALSQQRFALTFRTSEPLRREWYLALGEGEMRQSGPAHDHVVREYLLQMALVNRPSVGLVIDIAKNIGDYFFDNTPHKRAAHFESVIQKGKSMAEKEYQKSLEKRVQENPQQQIMPQKYTYLVGSGLFTFTR